MRPRIHQFNCPRTAPRIAGIVAICIALTRLVGCVGDNDGTPNAQLATALDPATTQPSHWLKGPGPTVRATDFDELWNACDATARRFFFDIDRTDFRGGVLTTMPLISRQWFELWRPDVRTLDDFNEASLANTRRTVRFEFVRDDARRSYVVQTKVLVERQAVSEQRITSVVNARGAFRRAPRAPDRARGTRESDEGVDLPSRYWYPVGRDAALEEAIAQAVGKRLYP